MELRFPSQKSIEISFKVGVAGTSAAPQTVSVVLDKGETALSFAAQKQGDIWVAVVDRPGMIFGDGPVQMNVHVVVNSRLFVPFKATAEIFSDAPSVIAVPQPEITPPVEPEVVAPVAQPEVELTLPLPVKPTAESILKKLEPAKPPAPKKVEEKVEPKIVARTVPKPAPVVKAAPKTVPVVIEANGLLKSIEPQIERKVEKVIEPAKPAPKAQPAFEMKRSKIVTI